MKTNGDFYKAKINDLGMYSIELKAKIEEAGNLCINSLNESIYSPIMLLGRIQSGKTRAYVGLIALVLDNDFDFIIVLSKNSKALVNQTYKRLYKEFSNFIESKQLIIKDIFEIDCKKELTLYEKKKKRIIVCKKQKQNLERIEDYLRINNFEKDKKILVIDDEADITTIGYIRDKNTNDEDGLFTMQVIANKINTIRGNFTNSVFFQVTATPYALYLQPRFDNEEILPIRPEKTVVIPSGEGYIGGKDFFLDQNDYYRMISDRELEFVTNNILDKRSINVNKLIMEKIIEKLVESIFTFIIGGCILKFNKQSDDAEYLSLVIHTNTQKNKHTNAENVIKMLLEQLNKNNRSAQHEDIEKRIIISYEILKHNIHDIPPLVDVKQMFYDAIDSETIKTIVVNSDNDVKTYLNNNGEIDLTTPFTIIIGGQTLDRGVTISNMVGFYYGRNPKSAQQDTVMQHMRVFGYRKESHLKITNIYTTRTIFERLKYITIIDEELRKSIEDGDQRDGIYLLKQIDGTIKPCARNKIATSDIIYVKGKKRILPIGFYTQFKSYTVSKLNKIESILANIQFDNKGVSLITLARAHELLSIAYSLLKKDEDSPRFYELQTMVDVINNVNERGDFEDKLYLLIRRNRNLSKYQENQAFQDAPDTKAETTIAYELAEQYPVLMLLQQNGTEENGWNGSKFWWPIYITPIKSDTMMMALDEPIGKVNRRV